MFSLTGTVKTGIVKGKKKDPFYITFFMSHVASHLRGKK